MLGEQVAGKKILYVSTFADPNPVNANTTSTSQVRALRTLGVNVDMLTCHKDPTWRVPWPTSWDVLSGIPYFTTRRDGIDYHVISPPELWTICVSGEKEWEEAVEWGCKALQELHIDLLHIQQWQNLWWLMESAQRMHIPVVYSVNDYGMACLRIYLMTGKGTPCKGRVSVDVCAPCIIAGRSRLGKVNEWMAMLPGMEMVLRCAYGKDGTGILSSINGVYMPARRRVGLTIERCRRISSSLDAMLVASSYAGDFFRQFGITKERIHVMPWFYPRPINTDKSMPILNEDIQILFAGRISPEKGLHILLNALQQVSEGLPFMVRVAGSVTGDYARSLQKRYSDRVGRHRIVWHGWLSPEDVQPMYDQVHLVAIPSLWFDNTPIVLTEAMAHRRPILCTDVPTMTHLVKNEVNGLVFPLGDTKVLAECLQKIAETPDMLIQFSKNCAHIDSVEEYAQKVEGIYNSVLGRY